MRPHGLRRCLSSARVSVHRSIGVRHTRRMSPEVQPADSISGANYANSSLKL